MRKAKTRFSSIGGALLAITVVLGVALHITERTRENAASGALAGMTGLPGRTMSLVAPLAPAGRVLDVCDATMQGRPRVVAHVIVPDASSRAIAATMSNVAQAVSRHNPGAAAIKILGYLSEGQRLFHGEAAPWTLMWSLDGRGWDGLAENDFDKHVYRSTE